MTIVKEFDNIEKNRFFRDLKEQANTKNLYTVLQTVYKKVFQIDIQLFYDFLGELSLEKTWDLGIILASYLRILKEVKMNPNQLIELEKYLVEKYFILNNEKLVMCFRGKLRNRTQNYNYRGRVFITDQRILVICKVKYEQSVLLAILGGI